MTAHIYASSLVTDHGRSLLERIISTGHLIGITMDWKEDLALGRIEASGIAGEFHSGSTWWLKLDGSDRNRWKIDVVDVSDSIIGEELVRNPLLVNLAIAMMEPTTRGRIPPLTIPRQSFQHSPRLCQCYTRCSRHCGRKPFPLLDLQGISAFNRQLCTLQ